MNHTSDQHPWFQASRSDPDGPYGDFYVWTDTDDKYTDARIIFVDTETSNWTFDPVRRQFFWHRFFSHQPDLNFENPAVHEAMLDVVRFWMDMGIDGFRLDAVPYLFERGGPQRREPPEDARVPRRAAGHGRHRVPRAGSCWPRPTSRPRDVVDYFGTEEEPECHMCFHFPVMPRLYYALREEKAAPIIDVLADTPAIPTGAQWGTFLRNHDELTLEMVTTEERAAMYGWYAPDPRMRANVGIRRRLASLLDNSRAEVELIHALLLSLPGSPCLYYGDEIGMGDNIWLQRPRRRAHADAVDPRPQRRASPPPTPASSTCRSSSRSSTTTTTSTSRRRWRAAPPCCTGCAGCCRCVASTRCSGWATSRSAGPTHDRVLSFVRVDRRERDSEDRSALAVLCVNNLSSRPQSTTITLPEELWDWETRDLFGGSGFPDIAPDGTITITLGSRDFFWLALAPRRGEVRG